MKLDGNVDALVFSGGIGEKSAVLRKRVVEGAKCLGFNIVEDGGEQAVDDEKSDASVVIDISGVNADAVDSEKGRMKRVLVCSTDEQVRNSISPLVHRLTTSIVRDGKRLCARRGFQEVSFMSTYMLVRAPSFIETHE